MKFPFKFKGFGKGKKGSDDEEEEDDFEEDEDDSEESESDDDDDDDDDDDKGGGLGDKFGALAAKIKGVKFGELAAKIKGDKRLMMMVGGGAVVVLLLLGGGAWFLIGGDDGAKSEEGAEVTDGHRIVQEMPSRRRSGKKLSRQEGGLTPPQEGDSPPQEGAEGEPPAEIHEAGAQPPEGTAEVGSLNAVAATVKGPSGTVTVASVKRGYFRNIPVVKDATPLSVVAKKSMIEDSPQGPLPKLGRGDRKPWQVYARPFEAPGDQPRIAIIITGMGLSDTATMAAIKRLPGEVTLAFDPNVKDLGDLAALARRAGHEILISLPMESAQFPIHDPGPLAMLSALTPEENLERLKFVLSRFTNYVGVATTMGSKFSIDGQKLKPVLEAINSRGLMLVDGGDEPKSLAPKIATEISLPRAINDLFLDKNPSRAAIDAQLVKLEGIAREKAVAVAIAEPNPSTLERLSAWVATLKSKNLALAPISAIADRQAAR